MPNKCPPDIPQKPEILGDEDLPFPDSGAADDADGNARKVRLEENEQKHNHDVENYKNVVGGVLLVACFLVVISFSIIDAIFKIDSILFSGAFDFAKTIATAVIGYLFATNIKGK